MKIVIAVLLCIITSVGCTSQEDGEVSGSASGAGEEPPLPPVFEVPPKTYGNLTCDLYDSGGHCSLVLIEPLKVVTNWSRDDQLVVKKELDTLFGVLGALSGGAITQCSKRSLPLLCLYTFPPCDPAYNIPVYQPICKRDCELMRDYVCPDAWQAMLTLGNNVDFGNNIDDFDCEKLSNPNGGEAPMCVSTERGGLIPAPVYTGDCYRGKGRGYTGLISTTTSGLSCQPWLLPYPHQHLLSPYIYPELFVSYNYCRNPGVRGERPWCFTTDRGTRWEYCDVPQCDPGPMCEYYPGTVCRGYGSIGMDYVYINTSRGSFEEYDEKLISMFETVDKYPGCSELLKRLFCFTNFPLCDLSHDTPRPRPVCTEYCESIKTTCNEFFVTIESLLPVTVTDPLIIPDCVSNVSPPEGGTAPECYMAIPPDIGKGEPCYNASTKGRGYNGTVNITESGTPCQPWDDTVVHTHPISSLFRPYLTGHNYCRNPDGRGQRVWCYTNNVEVRWEYCNIPSCEMEMMGKNKSPITLPVIGGAAGGVALLILLLLIVVVVCICTCCRRSRKDSFVLKEKPSEPVEEFSMKAQGPSASNPLYSKKPQLSEETVLDEYSDVKLPEFPRDRITYICDLGEGHFGSVIRAEALGIIPGEDKTTVAIKVLKEGASLTSKKEFYREASLMVAFNHPNVLKLLGVCVEVEPLCMIFQYMDMGDLNNFLRQNAPAHMRSYPCTGPKTLPHSLSIKQLVEMCIDISAGLEHLALNHYVHRDLATRNCLINSQLRIKLADFGLSQDVYTSDYLRLGESEILPIRWMPPEAILYSTFSPQSDVWSFGIVLWEIFSYGMQPYFGMSNEEVVKYVRDAKVLQRPEGCPSEIYDLMLDCWNMDPSQRPKADEIQAGLNRWTPELSATIQTQARHPDYQNMSAILEMVRRSIEGHNTINIEGVADMGEASKENQSTTANSGYDHLGPKETNAHAIPNIYS